MELKQRRNEEARQEVEELRVLDAEEYTELKIKLETEIQIREQYLQEMKAIYQLNNEKLKHNFELLGERDFEHLQLIQGQKKKINRLQDLLSTLKGKYAKTDKIYRQKNMELTDEYRRITEQYKDLQIKFKHFQEMDQKKYMEIWEMNQERIHAQVKRLLQADKVITEQQLGWNWFPPNRDAELFELDVESIPEKQAKSVQRKGLLAEFDLYSDSTRRVLELISDEFGFMVLQQNLK